MSINDKIKNLEYWEMDYPKRQDRMFTDKLTSKVKAALSIFANQPTIELESWENENDVILIDNDFVLFFSNEFILYEIQYYPGNYHNSPEQNEIEITSNQNLDNVLSILIQILAQVKFNDILTSQ